MASQRLQHLPPIGVFLKMISPLRQATLLSALTEVIDNFPPTLVKSAFSSGFRI